MADLPQTNYNVTVSEVEFPGEYAPIQMNDEPMSFSAAGDLAILLVNEAQAQGYYYNGLQPVRTATARQQWTLLHIRSTHRMVIEVKAEVQS